jgi:pimeloyl-ACP methyl ester carboxylesterase
LCSCASQQERELELQLKSKSDFSQAQQTYPRHWKLNKFKTEIFGSEIIVAEIQSETINNFKKPTVLLVHGLSPNGMQDWLNVTEGLSVDYNVIAVDLPGFGFSGDPEGKYSPKRYAQMLHEVKRKYAPHSKWAVIGYSMGGAVSLRYSERYPDEIDRLVLVSVAGILERTTYLKHTVLNLMDGYKSSPRVESFIKFFKNPVGKLVESINGLPDPTKILNYDRVWEKVFSGREEYNAGMALIGEDFSKAIYTSKLPVTLIWGDQDKVAPLRTGKLLAAQMPFAEIEVIEGAGHNPMVTHPERVRRYMLEGLKKEIELNNKNENPVNEPSPESNEVLYLKDEDHVVIENAAYKTIRLVRCDHVSMKNVRLGQLVMERSSVKMENVFILSEETALSLDQSKVEGTNVVVKGKYGVWSSKSRVDLVGGQIEGLEQGVIIRDKSQLLFSISRLNSPVYQGYMHGSYRLSRIVLDDHLRENQ